MSGVQTIGFKALVFSNTLTILLENEAEIDHFAIQTFLYEGGDSVELCRELRLHSEYGQAVLRGYKLANGMYITSKVSDSYYSINYGVDRKTVDDLLHCVVHMHKATE
jgi:hypothetical protein